MDYLGNASRRTAAKRPKPGPSSCIEKLPLFTPIPMKNGNDELITGIVGSDQCNIWPSLDSGRKNCVEVHLIVIIARADENANRQMRIARICTDSADIRHQFLETEVPAFQAVKADAYIDLVVMLQSVAMAAQAMTKAIEGYNFRETLTDIVLRPDCVRTMRLAWRAGRQGCQDACHDCDRS